ncbi:MAG: TfoX/Sxy family protein [Ignavibacteria bacterium]|nr:TfoX/Sxy family protein [Ignavibacteria bacterium]
METKTKNSLKEAKNLGSTIIRRLNEIGVYSLADLAEMTSVKAYKKICEQNSGKTFPVCYYLYSLEGAMLDLHWDDLPEDLKSDLLQQIGRVHKGISLRK